MQTANVDSIQMFRNVNGVTVGIPDLKTKYGFTPDGTNIYIGFGELVDRYLAHQALLMPWHSEPITTINSLVADGTLARATINVSLEPDYPKGSTKPADYYDFVSTHNNVLQPLAEALQSLITPVPAGASMQIVIRYASEMNAARDSGDPYAGDPDGFQNTATQLRNSLGEAFPNLFLAFSPAINTADGSLSSIQQYWPGVGVFDIVSCTWYSRPTDAISNPVTAYQTAFNRLQAYIGSFLPTGGRFGIDEMGGCYLPMSDNDDMLQRMLGGLSTLAVPVEYVTIFLSVDSNVDPTQRTVWGVDATLNFLHPV